MTYRIAFIGAQGTGKTTLANLLVEQLKLPHIKEIARKYNIPDATPDQLIDIQKNIQKDQLKQELMHYEFISDRSVIDHLAYWLCNCSERVTIEDNRTYINKALGRVSRYTHLFYLAPEFEIEHDGFRATDKTYQTKIDSIIKTILFMFNIPHVKLTGTVEQRLKQIDNALGRSP